MKRVFCVAASLLIMALEGCTVAPSMLGGDVSGMLGAGASKNSSAIAIVGPDPGLLSAPDQTGSIVPLADEGAVVDLPYAGHQVQASSSYQGTSPQAFGEPVSENEQIVSPSERHRQELINRGDLQEGQPLPR